MNSKSQEMPKLKNPYALTDEDKLIMQELDELRAIGTAIAAKTEQTLKVIEQKIQEREQYEQQAKQTLQEIRELSEQNLQIIQETKQKLKHIAGFNVELIDENEEFDEDEYEEFDGYEEWLEIKGQKLLHKIVKLESEVDRNRMTITASSGGFNVDAPIEETLLLGYSHAEINHIKSYNDDSMPWFNLDCYRTANNIFIVKVKKLYLADQHVDDSFLVWGDAEFVFNAAKELVKRGRTTPKHDSETLDKLYAWLKPHLKNYNDN